MLKYCSDEYKTQGMCDKVLDFYLTTLIKFVPDWFVRKKLLETLDNFIFSNDDTSLHDVDSNIITFLKDDMVFLKDTMELILLTVMVMIVLMKMIQKLSIILDL